MKHTVHIDTITRYLELVLDEKEILVIEFHKPVSCDIVWGVLEKDLKAFLDMKTLSYHRDNKKITKKVTPKQCFVNGSSYIQGYRGEHLAVRTICC